MGTTHGVILVGHGGIPKDYPGDLVTKLKRLEGQRKAAGAPMSKEEHELDQKIRLWPRTPETKRALVSFHTSQKYLVLAHSRHHYQKLGQLMANAQPCTPRQLATLYGQLFMEALTVKTTVRKHMNVLLHLTGHLKGLLSSRARVELHEVMHAYHQGLVSLSAPITLLRHYSKIFDLPYLQDQTYLNPHPKELLLRNHV